MSHGFLRDRNGGFTTFDVPGAGTGAGQGTFPFAISPGGEITGFYVDGTDANHGFLRDKNGVITTFDVPGAGTDPFQGTFGGGFTPNGAIMGNYFDADTLSHGFLRNRMAPSRRSMRRMPVTFQVPSKVPTLLESIRMERSRDGMLTRQM